ncbi:MAG TPA: NAD-dependent epimerase/dehydratase family protein [Thermoanaerobaculia bacterium]|jgi:CDP-paratose 2-epimerase|nr:NAD-dependent epimerase/dehydratase family protein [Thermoanaerobaculia bacterium]
MTNVANESYVLITGGCGFVGTNLADRLLREGHRVCVYDNLSRPGVERNLAWLRETHGSNVIAKIADTRDAAALRDAVRRASAVYHLAAQVAVTTSLADPAGDFDVNAGGTVNVLEAIRGSMRKPPLFFTSTNKVYGGLEDVHMDEEPLRYRPRMEQIAQNGVSEERPLDFHSPYGCSKGAADQYVRDYARSYGLRTVVFRMSCIYGPHQFGTEDQGWVAHFLIRALNREPITIYGDGKQVRDILFVEDLVDAFLLAAENIEECSGRAFNIGGGAANTISLRELLAMIRRFEGREARVEWGDWRTGDQKYYVSDTALFREVTGWAPKVGTAEGIRRLREWLVASGVPAVVQQATEAEVARAPLPVTHDVPAATVPATE